MKKIVCLSVLCLFMCALTYMAVGAVSAQAAGFALYEWDNRANGMGGAVIASDTPNPSAMAYNPAGITKLEGIQAQVGATIIAPSAHVKLEAGTINDEEREVDTKSRVFVVPHAFGTFQISDNWWVGVGEFTRFGLGTHYDHSWAGRADIYKVNMETYSSVINAAYKVNDALSVSVGFEYLYGKMDMRTDKTHLPAFGPLTLGSEWKMFPEGYGTSWNLSMLWEPKDWISFGLVWRKGFTFFGTGDVEYIRGAAAGGGTLDDTMKMRADFPGSVSFGTSVKPSEDLTLEVDVIRTFWSSFDTMDYFMTDEAKAFVTEMTDRDFASVKNYKDAWRLQLGAEWQAWDDIFLRGGFVWDESPQSYDYLSYMLPSNDRYIASTGLGLDLGAFEMDFSLMYLWAKDRHFNNEVTGTYETWITDSTTWLGGMSFIYTF